MLLQATRGRRAEVEARVYYNVGRENVQVVYYNVAASDAEAGAGQEPEYEDIDLQRDAGEPEYHLYEDIDLHRAREEPVYEVDL